MTGSSQNDDSLPSRSEGRALQGLPADCEIYKGINATLDSMFLRSALKEEKTGPQSKVMKECNYNFDFCETSQKVIDSINKTQKASAGFLDILSLSLAQTAATQLELSNTKVAIVFSGVKHEKVEYALAPHLSEDAKTQLDKDFDDFLRIYGHGYVNEICYGASVYWAVVFQSSSRSTIDSFKSSASFKSLWGNLSLGLTIKDDCEKIQKDYDISISVKGSEQGIIGLACPTTIQDIPEYITNFANAKISTSAGLFFETKSFSTLPEISKNQIANFEIIDSNLKSLYEKRSNQPKSNWSWSDWKNRLYDLRNQHQVCLEIYKIYGPKFAEKIEYSMKNVEHNIRQIDKVIQDFKSAPLHTVDPPDNSLLESDDKDPDTLFETKRFTIGSGEGGGAWDGAEVTGSPGIMIGRKAFIEEITLAPGYWDNNGKVTLVGGIKFKTNEGKEVSKGKNFGHDWAWGTPITFARPPALKSIEARTGTFVDKVTFTFRDGQTLTEGGETGVPWKHDPISEEEDWMLIGFSGREGVFIDRLVVTAVKLLDPFAGGH